MKPTMATPDHGAFRMPFTPNRQFKTTPHMVVSAEGIADRTADGREVLDGTLGLWCVGAGHRHPGVAAAMKAQIDTLDYASSFQVGHPGAVALTERIAPLAPPGMDRVFLVNKGSEACDTAMKIALAYWRAMGQGQRAMFVGLEGALHGVGFGGISVGGMTNNRRAFGSAMLRADHLRSTWDPASSAMQASTPSPDGATNSTNADHDTTRFISSRNSRLGVRFVVRFNPRSACFMSAIFPGSLTSTKQIRSGFMQTFPKLIVSLGWEIVTTQMVNLRFTYPIVAIASIL